MIINKEYWTTSAKDILSVSVALSWDKIAPRLNDTWTQLFIPLLGNGLCEILENAAAIQSVEDGNSADFLLLYYARKALCNLTFWTYFDEMSVRVTDQGFQRQESDTFKTPYKYQSDAMKHNYKNAGFNALEVVIASFEEAYGNDPRWMGSPCCTARLDHIVQSKREVMDVFNIHDSYIVFLALQSDIKVVEDTVIPGLLGAKLNDALRKAIRERAETINDHCTTEELRLRTSRVVVAKALLRYIERYGSITDRGYFYGSYKAEAGNNTEARPVDADMRQVTINQLKEDARNYEAMLDSLIEDDLSEFRSSKPSNALIRDNEHKRTFWA